MFWCDGFSGVGRLYGCDKSDSLMVDSDDGFRDAERKKDQGSQLGFFIVDRKMWCFFLRLWLDKSLLFNLVTLWFDIHCMQKTIIVSS